MIHQNYTIAWLGSYYERGICPCNMWCLLTQCPLKGDKTYEINKQEDESMNTQRINLKIIKNNWKIKGEKKNNNNKY